MTHIIMLRVLCSVNCWLNVFVFILFMLNTRCFCAICWTLWRGRVEVSTALFFRSHAACTYLTHSCPPPQCYVFCPAITLQSLTARPHNTAKSCSILATFKNIWNILNTILLLILIVIIITAFLLYYTVSKSTNVWPELGWFRLQRESYFVSPPTFCYLFLREYVSLW